MGRKQKVHGTPPRVSTSKSDGVSSEAVRSSVAAVEGEFMPVFTSHQLLLLIYCTKFVSVTANKYGFLVLLIFVFGLWLAV